MSGRSSGRKIDKFARALIGASGGEGSLRGVITALESFLPTYRGNTELRRFFENPLVPVVAKKQVADKIPDLPPLALTFLKVILDALHAEDIPAILARTIDMGYESLKRIPVRITTAFPLSSELVLGLKTSMEKKLQSEVVLQTQVDPSVIGGVRIALQGKVLDGTIPGRLRRLEKYLLGSNA